MTIFQNYLLSVTYNDISVYPNSTNVEETRGRFSVKHSAIICFLVFASQGISDVTISGNPLTGWNMTGYTFSDVSSLRNLMTIQIESGILNNGPVFLRGRFTIDDQPLDTFLDTAGWGKGVAFVNGHNLGRYWPVVGPQITLYVPAPYLRTGENELIILELEYMPQARKMKFQSTPNLTGTMNLTQSLDN